MGRMMQATQVRQIELAEEGNEKLASVAKASKAPALERTS